MSEDKIITSQTLKEDAEKEFGNKIIESNAGVTRYSSRDKSYSNLFDFFIKTGKAPSDRGTTQWSRLSSREKMAAILKGVAALILAVAFIIFAMYFEGRVGLILGILIIFALWFLWHHMSKGSGGR